MKIAIINRNEEPVGMEQLFPVHYDENGKMFVYGRELYSVLEVHSNYTTWFARMAEYGFDENTDFKTCFPNLESENHGGQNKIDHKISISMAKELAMLQRTEIGSKVRKYLVAVEEAWNTPEKIMARAYQISKQMLDAKTVELEAKTRLIEEMKPKAIFADAVSASETSILVGELAKLIKQNGVDIGQKRLFEWLRNNGWLMKKNGIANYPTQTGMERGYFEIKERVINNPDGTARQIYTTKVTGKGQQYFVNYFLQ